ncbi:predicted protein, partial [Haematococcus lacustris]
VAFMLQHQLVNSHNAWMLQPQGYGDVGLLNGFLPLDSLAASNAALAWPGILPIVQQRQAKYLGKVVAMPLDVHVNLLFYRLDVALNRSDSAVRGVVGVGQLPGSSMVYARTRQGMVPCSVELCPFSVEADLARLA